jgi:hypothetical protein
MPAQQRVYKVFVSSPSDLAIEREMLDDVVAELNTLFTMRGISLKLIRWETNVHPAVGADAQEVINKQIPADYDIFLGILWARFGSPTPRAESGTLEEFEHALSRYHDDPSAIKIMFYFKDEPIPPSSVDPEQLRAVHDFRAELGSRGVLYKTYDQADDFVNIVRPHLALVIQEWEEAIAIATAPKIVAATRSESPLGSAKPSPDQEAVGLVSPQPSFDETKAVAREKLRDARNALKALLQSMREYEPLESRLYDLRTLVRRGDTDASQRMANELTGQLRGLTGTLQAGAGTWLDSLSASVVHQSELIASLIQSNQLPEAVGLIKTNLELAGILRALSEALRGYRNSVARLPLVTEELASAKRALLRAFKDFETSAANVARTIDSVTSLLPETLPTTRRSVTKTPNL